MYPGILSSLLEFLTKTKIVHSVNFTPPKIETTDNNRLLPVVTGTGCGYCYKDTYDEGFFCIIYL